MSENNITDHEYDGIEEYDNALPNWWLATLWITVIFGVGYWAYYHTFAVGADQASLYEAEMAAAGVQQAEAAEAQAEAVAAGEVEEFGLEQMLALVADPEVVAQGETVFSGACVSCHAADLTGGIGPNLIDEETIYGNGPMEILASVRDGRSNGMIAWGDTLGPTSTRAVAAYVASLAPQAAAEEAPAEEAANACGDEEAAAEEAPAEEAANACEAAE